MPDRPPPVYVALLRPSFEHRLRAALPQVLGTLAILASAAPNPVTLLALLAWWALTMGDLTWRELVVAGGLDLLFTALDIGAVRAGVFTFHHPDWMGLPCWEILMWGFYGIHGLRLIGRGVMRPVWWTWLLAIAFATPYLCIADPVWLAASAGAVLAVSLACMHRPADLAAAGYFTLLGMLIECTGMAAGHWSYPHSTGLPVAALLMWAGVGLFMGRLVHWWIPAGPTAAPDARTQA